ncbi:MAG: MFS transporter [Alphaproteobacteria bacterium]|nr:MFS transporter [Alphaproteobacteria bacterium]
MTAREGRERVGGPVFWKIAGAGAAFQAGSSAVDTATIIASLVNHLTGNVYAVGAASAILRLGWLLPQLVVGFLAQRARRSMPFYIAGAFGRAACLAFIAVLLAVAGAGSGAWLAGAFLILWTLYAFISGIVAVPYNDIVGRSISSGARSRLLAWRFFGGGILALGVAALVHHLLATQPVLNAHALIFLLASVLMVGSAASFISAGEPPAPAIDGEPARRFRAFLADGLKVMRTDPRFRLFLYTQWVGGATFMALPFYVVAAARMGLGIEDVGILLGAQTAGALASNALWGHIGDRFGKLVLLQVVAVLRLAPPLGVFAILTLGDNGTWPMLPAFAALFVAIGALVNGMTIGYLGYLMEVSPNHKRPAYSAYFNALASPAALLPLAGAAVADTLSLEAVFVLAVLAATVQLALYARLARWENA